MPAMDAVQVHQLVRNARRAYERASIRRSLPDAMNYSGRLLARYCGRLPDTRTGLKARQQITEAANAWLEKVEQQGKKDAR